MVAVASVWGASACLPVFAGTASAVLSEVDIASKPDSSYQITVKADKNVSYNKYVTSKDKIVIDIDGVKPASFVNTVYNNATNVDHVIIQPVSDNKVRVFIQGDNVSSSTVNVDTGFLANSLPEQAAPVEPVTSNATVNAINSVNVAPETATTASNAQPSVQEAPSEQTIVLDQSVDNFRPVSDVSSDSDESPSMGIAYAIKGALKSFSTASPLDWMLRLLSVGILVFSGLKLIKPKKQVKIKLSAQPDEKLREISLLKSRNDLLKQELMKGNPSVLNKTGVSSFSRYGMQEYQNSQLPPVSNSMPLTRGRLDEKPMRPQLKPKINNEISLRKVPATPSSLRSSSVATKIGSADIQNAQSNFDSVQFLERMAKIYERSGRLDLARDIQNSIVKSKMAG